MFADTQKAKTLPPATADEVEWAVQRALHSHTNDFIRRGILRAETEEDALSFVRYTNNGGMCGPSGAPGEGRYPTTSRATVSTPGSASATTRASLFSPVAAT